MIFLSVILQLLAVPASVPGQIDIVCRPHCQVLAIQGGKVRLLDKGPLQRDLSLGQYAAPAQASVPRSEAPVTDLRTSRGWRLIASVYLDHQELEARTHLRFISPDGRLRSTEDALEYIEVAKAGNYFGGTDEVFIVTSNEEHAYNDQTEVWYLPPRDKPKLLLEAPGSFERFINPKSEQHVGIVLARQGYDGVHAQTKGTQQELYSWNSIAKTLVRVTR
jgi:hypothetical protein